MDAELRVIQEELQHINRAIQHYQTLEVDQQRQQGQAQAQAEAPLLAQPQIQAQQEVMDALPPIMENCVSKLYIYTYF